MIVPGIRDAFAIAGSERQIVGEAKGAEQRLKLLKYPVLPEKSLDRVIGRIIWSEIFNPNSVGLRLGSGRGTVLHRVRRHEERSGSPANKPSRQPRRPRLRRSLLRHTTSHL